MISWSLPAVPPPPRPRSWPGPAPAFSPGRASFAFRWLHSSAHRIVGNELLHFKDSEHLARGRGKGVWWVGWLVQSGSWRPERRCLKPSRPLAGHSSLSLRLTGASTGRARNLSLKGMGASARGRGLGEGLSESASQKEHKLPLQ